MRVDNICRKFVHALSEISGGDSKGTDPGDNSSQCILCVTIAVCVTFSGIIVFFTGISRTICAASAEIVIRNFQVYSEVTISLTIAQDIELWRIVSLKDIVNYRWAYQQMRIDFRGQHHLP